MPAMVVISLPFEGVEGEQVKNIVTFNLLSLIVRYVKLSFKC